MPAFASTTERNHKNGATMSDIDFVTYKDAGVDINYGDMSVKHMKPAAQKTHRPGVLSGIGGFAGLFSLKDALPQLQDPVLVSGTDGVGTKLLVAIEANRHESIGQDLVAMCANDVLCAGAKPLFFLDYFSSGSLSQSPLLRVVQSIAQACQSIDCVLIGGESAEMPGLYTQGQYDIAGFCVGVVERKNIVDGSQIKPGDQIIGLSSSGLHSNGFSLARKIILERMQVSIQDKVFIEGHGEFALAQLLLEPTKIYVNPILSLLSNGIPVKSMAHITGGGIAGNLRRPFPKGLSAVVDTRTWNRPPLFDFLKTHGPVTDEEMRKTFNMGIGFAIVAAAEHAQLIVSMLSVFGESASIIGHVAEQDGSVVFVD
jgi:phosphoribosylformylglycinamidine cyclo-ligase